jgi:hypothetical protein
MNRTTILSVVIALGSLGLAISMRPVEIATVAFEDTGTPLFPNFSDPAQATSLEVTGWDEAGARVTSFKVEQKAGRWVIPSHNDYPADGTERMGKAAASFIDVKKDVLRSERAEDHAQFGVEDPADANAKGRGQRVTIKDQAGTVLVDIILGKKLDDKDGFRYVRIPDQKRVYASKIEVDISTNFTDWIEKDLLKIEQEAIVAFLSDSYKVDETQGKVTNRDPLLIRREPDPSKPEGEGTWVVGAETPGIPGKELDTGKIRQVLGGVDRLQIVGVRPRPEQLTLQALQSKGFFVTPDGRRLFGNEGEVKAFTNDGVVYTLYFGEITLDVGLALTAGTEDPSKPADAKPEGAAEKEANRFMFVDVAYDPASDRTVNPAGPPPEEPEGAKRAKQLQARFDKWFYVISDASFKQIRKDKAEFFKDAAAGTGSTPAAPGTPAKKPAATPGAPATPATPAKKPAAPAPAK